MRAICVWINGVKLSQSKCYNFFSALCSDLFIILVKEVKKKLHTLILTPNMKFESSI